VSKVLLKTEAQQQEGVLGLEVPKLANYLDLSLDLGHEEVRPKCCTANRVQRTSMPPVRMSSRAYDFDIATISRSDEPRPSKNS
jgi:hypothetical protein